MRKSDFRYDLPPELIAQHPVEPRSASRLLDVTGGVLADRCFAELPSLLKVGDLLVFNDTRVLRARLFGEKETGGRVELLVERVLDEQRLRAQVRASKTLKSGQLVHLEGGVRARVLGRTGEFFDLAVEGEEVETLLSRVGRLPLPPYIKRAAGAEDEARYQTVYARRPGAVAAPTAGLHFDPPLLQALAAAGIEQAFVTLHVGAGTFQPVRVDDVTQHRMHAERAVIDPETAARINTAKRAGRRVVAVGTTVVRTLESAATEEGVGAFDAETDIFIRPGYRFRAVDALITNFHLPESTLLMLVYAFGGSDRVRAAYAHAIAQRYRFFSYGDAMLLTRALG